MRLIASLFLAAATILFTGCETPGRSLAKSAVEQIKDGSTTRADVDRIFGEPRQMTRSPAGATLYYYERFYGPSTQQSAFSDESHLLILTVLFDGRDIVEKHLYSHTKPNVNSRSLRVGQPFAKSDLARIVPGKTTRAELNGWFGPHWSEELTLAGSRMVAWVYGDAFDLTGSVRVQALEVLLTDAGVVASFRVTNRDR